MRNPTRTTWPSQKNGYLSLIITKQYIFDRQDMSQAVFGCTLCALLIYVLFAVLTAFILHSDHSALHRLMSPVQECSSFGVSQNGQKTRCYVARKGIVLITRYNGYTHDTSMELVAAVCSSFCAQTLVTKEYLAGTYRGSWCRKRGRKESFWPVLWSGEPER